ncbi:hypothetical protein K3495_g648 [Podosphaera aphanis]|nr:hypothetical protein K3495_g648 [Podosphaera aphanis]
MAQLALNSRPNSAIGGMSPFFLRHGYELDPLMEPAPPPDDKSRHPGRISAMNYVQRLKDAQDLAQASMMSSQQRYEQNGNRICRQPERFEVGDKKLAWQHAKYEVTAVSDALTVELNVPGNIHKRFHVELIKRAGDDPLSNQYRDDAQNPPLLDNLEEPEYEVEAIIRARTTRRGRGKFRQALVKWVGRADPT